MGQRVCHGRWRSIWRCGGRFDSMSLRFLSLCIFVTLFAVGAGCSSPPSTPTPAVGTSWLPRFVDGTKAADAGVVDPAPQVSSNRENSLTGDFADPFVLRDEHNFYAFATGVAPLNIQLARSHDLAAWTLLGEALPELPSWALKVHGLTWAPSALARRDRYILYYTTRDAASGFQCISRAVATNPEGPYNDDSSGPLVCQVGSSAPFCGSIDPSPFLDADGKPYLLWKSDENSNRCRTNPRIWVQALSDDGLTLVGSPQMLLAVDQRWEDTIVEAPSMVLHDGRYFLFYSGNRYESGDYAVGYASCPTLFGLCTKMNVGTPYLMSTGSMRGPGGQELFQDATGEIWMAYHAWTEPKTSYGDGGARSLRIARMAFDEEGNPRPVKTPDALQSVSRLDEPGPTTAP